MLDSAVLLTFRKSWGYLFNNDIGSPNTTLQKSRMAYIDTDVVTLVASILPIVALFQIPDFACAITSGILRARGKQVRALPCSGRHVADRSLSVHWGSTQS
jgi:MATE family multidrug resistance protein